MDKCGVEESVFREWEDTLHGFYRFLEKIQDTDGIRITEHLFSKSLLPTDYTTIKNALSHLAYIYKIREKEAEETLCLTLLSYLFRFKDIDTNYLQVDEELEDIILNECADYILEFYNNWQTKIDDFFN